MKDGLPWMAFSVQGGDSQDQNLLQCFLNIVEFGMTPQQSVEAPNMNSFQMRNSFQDHTSQPGRMLVASSTSEAVRAELQKMGYTLQFSQRTSGPITAIWFDRKHGTLWGAAAITARTTASPGESGGTAALRTVALPDGRNQIVAKR
jgi:gamma-glutamyltranspeptidase/glutathione hydrolase